LNLKNLFFQQSLTVVTETPWEETDQYIRSGHRSPEDFEPDSFRTITISEDEGIKAVVGKPKGKETMEVQSYLFDKAKGWTLEKAKAWFEEHREGLVKEHVSAILPFKVLEKIVDKPLLIRGIAMTAGMSRNFNIYTPDELQSFAQKLISAPVYIEHVAVLNAVGKVAKAWWDPQTQAVWYEAEIYDDEVAEKIRKGLIQHVSVGADYETIDVLDGKVPHGLHNAELSLVAVPGIPETNIQVLESFQQVKARASESLPLKAAALIDDFRLDGREYITPGEYILGFHRDPYAFMPEHFSTVWLDRENGVLALIGRLRQEPEKRRIQAILFQREKWDEPKIRDWFLLHPHYLIESASAPTGIRESAEPLKEHGGKMQEQKNAGSNPSKTENVKPPQNPSGINRLMERVWTRKYINDLPDSAFAVILPGGEKDGEGKTTPRSLRKFPHHTNDGKIDPPHLRNANARVPQSDLTDEQKREAMRHLAAHKKALGIGMAAEEAKLVEQEPVGDVAFGVSPEPTLDELIASIEDIVDQINTAIENLDERIQKLEQTQTSEKASEKTQSKVKAESVAEQLLAKPAQKDPNLIDKRLILELIPPERVVRSWSYGPRQLVNKIRYVLTQSQSSSGLGVAKDELGETKNKEKGEG